MDKLQAVMNRFPQHAYNPEDVTSVLYKFVKAFIDEFNIAVDNINRINNLLNINTVSVDDLYNRYGSLLGIKQNPGETGEQYRDRLKVSISTLSGGTANAIKYAISCGLGINEDPVAMDRIHIYDAWDYNGSADVYKDYGYIVCEIDLNNGSYSVDMEQAVMNATNEVKAAGVITQFIYYNFRIEYYIGLDNITYASLSTLTYGQVGE